MSADAPAYAGADRRSAARRRTGRRHPPPHTGRYRWISVRRDGQLLAARRELHAAERHVHEVRWRHNQRGDSGSTDAAGNPVNTTTDESLGGKNSSNQSVQAWTSDKALAATDASGNPSRTRCGRLAQTSAFLRRAWVSLSWGSGFLTWSSEWRVPHRDRIGECIVIAPATYWASVVADEHEKAGREGDNHRRGTDPRRAT